MEKAEFDDYFAVLDKSADRARSVVYAFIIVHIAVLLYGVYAFAYPARQFTFDVVNLQIRCFYQPDDPKCGDYVTPDFPTSALGPPDLRQAIGQSFRDHLLTLFYDESVAGRTFKFPLFGLETDRDLLWLIFPLIGIIGYYIVWLALGRLASLLRFLIGRNQTDPIRLRLILAILVITTPLNTETEEITPLFQFIWRALAILVFAIPIIVIVLMMLDQTNAIAAFVRQVPHEVFLKNRSPGVFAQLICEALVLLTQAGLFRNLIALAISFGRDQTQAQRLIAALEAANP